MAHECSCHHESSVGLGTAVSPVRGEQTVEDVVHHHAGALEIMQRMGINHCCGAHLTLHEAAAAAGVPLDALLAALNAPPKTPA
jgi:iron-sulfur cluster repair protein YtfE (RIC family)